MAYVEYLMKQDSILERLQRINGGDLSEREKLIEDYIPFIIKIISNTLNRYIDCENSEEFSVGLEAFNEAISKYDSSKGSFIKFAKLVIQSRLKDYIKKNKKLSKVIPMSYFQNNFIINMNQEKVANDFTESIALKYEIQQFETMLKSYSISFEDLVKEAPKQSQTRLKAINIAKYIHEHQSLNTELLEKKTLPKNKLIKILQISSKTLSRNRKFIIATVLILNSNLTSIKDYLSI